MIDNYEEYDGPAANFSYKAECCGADCWAFEFGRGGPCWGPTFACDEVPSFDDDWAWVHSCEGHNDLWHGGAYKPEVPVIQYDDPRFTCIASTKTP